MPRQRSQGEGRGGSPNLHHRQPRRRKDRSNTGDTTNKSRFQIKNESNQRARQRASRHRRTSKLSITENPRKSSRPSNSRDRKRDRKRKHKKMKRLDQCTHERLHNICWIPARIQDFRLVNYCAELLQTGKNAKMTPDMNKQRMDLLLLANKSAAPEAVEAIDAYYKKSLQGVEWLRQRENQMEKEATPSILNSSATAPKIDGLSRAVQTTGPPKVNNATQTDAEITVTVKF